MGARRRQPYPPPPRRLEWSPTGCSSPRRAHTKAHRLERLEPYEGKLSRTVLRGERAGNSPLLLGLIRVKIPLTPLPELSTHDSPKRPENVQGIMPRSFLGLPSPHNT